MIIPIINAQLVEEGGADVVTGVVVVAVGCVTVGVGVPLGVDVGVVAGGVTVGVGLEEGVGVITGTASLPIKAKVLK